MATVPSNEEDGQPQGSITVKAPALVQAQEDDEADSFDR